MSKDTMKRLARANPVKSPPSVPAFRRPDGDDGPEGRAASRRRRARGHARRNGALALAAIAGAAVISVVLASGSSRSPVDVLAEVYAATAPRGGIVESVAVIRNNPGQGHRSTERLREWLQAQAGRRRAVISVSDSRGHASVDVVYLPSTEEAWGAGAADPLLPFSRATHNTIQRVRLTGALAGRDTLASRGGLVGEQWAKTFHTLYLKHQFSVVGKVRHRGQLLWKLAETPARARVRAREDQTSYYALVDPKTFLPVYTRLTDLARPGHPTLTEIELLSLRTLPVTAANEKLFDLALAHPGARVVTQTLSAVPPGPSSRGSKTAHR